MIPPRSVLFGTEGKMSWIKAPAINVGMSKGKWTSSGVMLNGGAYELSSNYAHRKFDFAWNLMSPEEVRKITRYFDGIYGDELLYYLDPFAMNSNVLPLSWSVPMLAADDAPPLILDQVPTLSTVATNTNDLPVRAATYTLSAGYVSDTVFIPVPDGEGLNIGVVGSRTGTAAVTFTPKTGSAVSPTLTGIGSTNLITNYMTNTGGGVTVSLTGLGTITLVAMQARVSPSEVGSSTLTTNLATNPSFETAGSTFEERRNAVLNPFATGSSSGFGQYSSGTGESGSSSVVGGASDGPVLSTGFRIPNYARRSVTTAKTTGSTGWGSLLQPADRAPSSGSSGDVRRAGVWLRYTAPDNTSLAGNLRTGVYNSGGTAGAFSDSATVTLVSGQWTFVESSVTATATFAFVGWWFFQTNARIAVVGSTLDATGAIVGPGESFNGSYSPDSDYVPSWTGTANASASILTGTRVATVTGGIRSTQWAADGTRSLRVDSGTATVPVTGPVVITARNSGQSATLAGTTVTSTGANQTLTLTGSGTLTLGAGWWDKLGDGITSWFSGATPSTGDTTYAWTGTANASTSTKTTSVPSPNAKQGFISGEGHSGLRLSGVANISGYSAPSALNLQSISATLTEVGAWEPQ